MTLKNMTASLNDKTTLNSAHNIQHLLYLLWASAGASVAIVIDSLVSQSHNNIFAHINTLYTYLSNPLPFGFFTKTILFILIACGASTIYYFKPASSKGAFAYGFGTLAILALFS